MPPNTTPHLELAESTAVVSKAPQILSTLWSRAPLVVAGLIVALAIASVALVFIGPSYTGRAMIQFNFIREEPATGARSLSTATVDAMAVVDSAAPIIRSHAIANAVVTRLGLDKDPAFARESLLWWAFSSMRSLFGFEANVPSTHDFAERQLIRRIAVTSDPRSYLVSISVTGADPEAAARLANAVALEYLRGQLLLQASDSYAAAEGRMSALSSTYGILHPAYQSEQRKLDDLALRLRALREEPFDETVATGVPGQSFVAAHTIMIPSGPNVILVFALTAVAELSLGAWFALRARPNELQRTQVAPLGGWRYSLRRSPPAQARSSNKSPQSHGLATSNEPVLAAVRKSDET